MACSKCREGQSFDLDITMAFHPIVDITLGTVWGYEALVRGTDGAPAGEILGAVDEDRLYRFDQSCRVKAIELAGGLFPRDSDTKLSINFMPNAVYEPAACIRASLDAAAGAGFDPRRIMFEFTEDERIGDTGHIERIVAEYKRLGFMTAIDDFGSGYSGLNLLAKFQPDLIKLDMELVRGIDTSPVRQAIVAGIASIARSIGVTLIAEGVETEAELLMLRAAGYRLFQGFLFARPAIERLPEISLPGVVSSASVA